MKFILKGLFKENIYNLMRKVNYHFIRKNEERGELEFARPPRGYPRFHLFLKIDDSDFVFNLHLDQKKPSYQGAPAHAGEYEGEIVEKEAERIKGILENAKN